MSRIAPGVQRSVGIGRLASVTALALLAPMARGGDAWPQFRGSDGQGRADDSDLPLRWSESEGVVWKTPIPGRGWSSPVVANGRIWLTTAEERAATDAEREKLMQAAGGLGPVKDMEAVASVKLSAVEVNLATGKVLRQIELLNADSPPPIHGLNSFASPTAAVADGLVLCHFGTMGTACIDEASGEVLWRRKLVIQHIVGPGSSPIIYKDLAIITCDGGDKQYIAALDLKTGKPRWQKDRPPLRNENPDLRKAYCTPLVVAFGGRDQMIIPGSQWFIAYDPTTGDEMWRVDHGNGFSNVPAPIFEGDTTYLDTGFGKAQLWAVRVDGSGDVTDTHVRWRHAQQMPTMPSPVIAKGRIFVISDGGVASCLDTANGKVVWRERVPGQYSASALLGAGRVYFCSHEGRTTVVAASDKFEVLAENKLDGKLMASPAAVDGDLILRTDSHLYRIHGGER